MALAESSSPPSTTARRDTTRDHESAVGRETTTENASTTEAEATPQDDEEDIPTGSAVVENDRISGTLGVEFGDIQSNGNVWHEAIKASITFCLDREAHMQRVGAFDLHVIDKEFSDQAYQKPWVAELLQSKAFHGDLAFVCSALRSLYDSDGAVIADFAEFADELETDTVVYVSMIRLEPEWRGMGLGSAAMLVLHRMLPSYCQNRGDITMLLQPDMLTEPGNTEEMRLGIQENLMRFYAALGYKLWHQEDEELPCYLLLGRTLEVNDHDDAEDVSSVDSRIAVEMQIE
ncbi:hypothetical protein B0A54_10126 [Friedmanniomyces endolithicus]|uniref:N-acetyltransferase domain-containing protein n=1 Tax=Friedmanniomyces endolithicus TaxID=329885 RepID=A0A4U0UU71_9PEZI|nr:hypothetical protein LTS09_003895 [Friedmanniomyces endolithicus]TKA39570.1 hypothetical protein B0A54_10126 [Friedmanniomyces endolithicus]